MSLTVVLAEPDAALRSALSEELAGHGWRVFGCECGVEAIEETLTQHPDVILISEALTHFTALDFLTIRHSTPELAHIPTLVRASTHSDPSQYFELEATGTVPFHTRGKILLSYLLRAKHSQSIRTALQGTFPEFSLFDVLQMLMAGRASGVLSVKDEFSEGTLCLLEGQVIDATGYNASGEDSLVTMLKQTTKGVGQFSFDKRAISSQPTITKRTDHILLAVANSLDESQ